MSSSETSPEIQVQPAGMVGTGGGTGGGASGGDTPNDTIFGRILRGEIPCDAVYADEFCLAFRDVNPQAPVHVLVIPREAIVNLADALSQHRELLGHLLLVAAKVAQQEGLGLAHRDQQRHRGRPDRVSPACARDRRPAAGLAAGLSHRGQRWQPIDAMTRGDAVSGSGSIPPDSVSAPPAATMPLSMPGPAPLESLEGPP